LGLRKESCLSGGGQNIKRDYKKSSRENYLLSADECGKRSTRAQKTVRQPEEKTITPQKRHFQLKSARSCTGEKLGETNSDDGKPLCLLFRVRSEGSRPEDTRSENLLKTLVRRDERETKRGKSGSTAHGKSKSKITALDEVGLSIHYRRRSPKGKEKS